MSYAETQERAADIIAEKGQAVTLSPHTAGSYDTATGGVTVTETPAVATTGVLLPLARGFAHRPDSNIRLGDLQLLLPGDIAAPVLGAQATIGGKPYTVIEVSPLAPGGTNLMYDCIVRGAG